ncbi:hypothetical protein SLEP1_g6168 [Rubroshorea leprosula]|uniref:Uncharacterized protein n=1 Tax=Rubroshorea leprosula TaxID=152421 RepID=A0AAV5HYR5_9ROSI|nr:hypothetical protein SLEP1_g6168 [Rubroshorea leprosula]
MRCQSFHSIHKKFKLLLAKLLLPDNPWIKVSIVTADIGQGQPSTSKFLCTKVITFSMPSIHAGKMQTRNF